MGQGSSQPARSGGQEPRETGRAAAAFRRFTLDRRREGRGREQNERSDGQPSEASSSPRRRPRRNSANRLSQILHWNEGAEANSEPSDALQTPGPHRLRFRLQDVLPTAQTTSQRPMNRLQRRVPLPPLDIAAAQDRPIPRLPSLDITSAFEDAFPSAAPPRTRTEIDSASHEAAQRRQTLRLNSLRSEPGFNPFRSLTNSLRRRRSPQTSLTSDGQGGNEDQATLLSRLLSVAAAATAATLMGDNPNAISEARSLTGGEGLGDVAGGGEDGSFDGFLRALQNGRIASALRQGTNDGDMDNGSAPATPLNFFRMFRFGPAADAADVQATGPGSERLVPIIIVGIRSIAQDSSNNGALNEELPPFVDALGSFPPPLPREELGETGNDSIDAILRPPQNSTSFRHRRRASMGGLGLGRSRLDDRMDDQRDQRSPDRTRERPWSTASSTNWELRPPPATPASLNFSRMPSYDNTPAPSRPTSVLAPSVRDSVGNDGIRNSLLRRTSALSPLTAHTEETASLHSAHSSTNRLSDIEPVRLHRRSDTAPNIHYPRFASGHPRRNGIVEPDHVPSLSRTTSRHSGEETRTGDARSWIIYVLGGSYPENHPILTTPSLFTENPTYEDMMLLSALLGPAKAPVASEEDVESAGGVYDIVSTSALDDADKTASLVALASSASAGAERERIYLEAAQRCLVCLCDFEPADVARKLAKCHHLFHRECIDQWLTTGRNSCPLCREQGVDEKAKPAASEEAVEQEEGVEAVELVA